MTTEEALLAAVLAAPNDDLPRLVLADHYEGELGQPERAEFIRVQVEIAKVQACPVPHNGGTGTGPDPAKLKRERLAELKKREKELLNAHYVEWLRGVPPGKCHVV